MTQKINKFYFRRGSKIIPYNASKSIFLESLIITKKKTLWPIFMDGVQLPQGYCHFEEAVYFLPLSSQIFLVLILSTSKDERLNRPWSHPVLLNTEPLDWKSSTLTTRPLLDETWKREKKISYIHTNLTTRVWPSERIQSIVPIHYNRIKLCIIVQNT